MKCFCDFPVSELVMHGMKCEGGLLGSIERFKDFLPSVHDVSPTQKFPVIRYIVFLLKLDFNVYPTLYAVHRLILWFYRC